MANGPRGSDLEDSGPKRVTVTLGEADVERLDEISRAERVSRNDAIRRALATEAFVQRTLAAGRKILIEDADGKIREVEFVK
jgi:metal-responsive CopG/Arc/MetJ family transcriptional regulator